jgi:redox-sensitive bicupin YhaK (pirin superfamily)
MRDAGGAMHGIQAWVAMPEQDEERAPGFSHHDRIDLPTFHDTGIEARLIAGTAYGLSNAVKTYSPMFYLHAELQTGARLGLPRGHVERAAYIVRGSVGCEGQVHGAGKLLVFTANDDPFMTAQEPSCVMLIGGEPLGPRHIWWNFVSSRKERIEQAKADWRAGRFRLPIHDDKEFVPLPQETKIQRPPEAEPMS